MKGIHRRLLIGVFCVGFVGCSPFFVLRAGYEEAKILSRRQSIARLVEDRRLPEEERAKLELVLAVRDFAQDSLELNAGDSYTTFSRLDSDTIALVLSAARKDRFQIYTWWFPIVGRVPYRAHFSEASARRAVERLEQDGYDAYVRPTAAFSTLGWFNDPLVSPLLRYDSVSLTNTVVHELVHNTIYLPGQATFNESLAQFAGARGAIAFFCAAEPDAQRCSSAEQAWHDELIFGRYLSELVADLDTLYARDDLTSEQKIEQRNVVFDRARAEFEAEIRPQLTILTFANFTRAPLNNASLIARRIYYTRLDLFEEVFEASGRDLRVTLQRIQAAAEADRRNPYEAVAGILRGSTIDS